MSLARGLLPELVGYHLRRAQVTVFLDFASHMAGLELTPGQFGVLVLIDENSGLSQTALGRELGLDRSTVVQLIDRLQQRGLVERAVNSRDRRSHALRLGDAGRALLVEATRRVRAHEAHLARALSDAERSQLIRLLARIGG